MYMTSPEELYSFLSQFPSLETVDITLPDRPGHEAAVPGSTSAIAEHWDRGAIVKLEIGNS